MSAPGPRSAADINLDEFERRLRAAGALQTGAEDPLAELARLVESSRVSVSSRTPSTGLASAPPEEELAPPIAMGVLRPAIDDTEPLKRESADSDIEASGISDLDASRPLEGGPTSRAADRARPRLGVWVPALALAGVAMIGAVFWLKGGVPGLQKQPPFIAAAPGPTKVQPPTDETVTAPSDTGTAMLRDNSKPGSVKVINSEEQPVDLSAQGSLGNSAPVLANAPATVAAAPSQPGVSSGTRVAATVDTPVVALPPGAAPATPSQFPDPKPVRTVSLRPDGTPIPSIAASDQPGETTPANPPPQAPAKPAPKTTNDTAGLTQSSTPKIDLPTKLSGKSSARVVVAKTDTTAAEAAGETPNPQTLKPEKAVKKPKPAQTGADAAAAPEAPATQAVDPTTATASNGWAVQLAAPKSETEVKSDLTRLNTKYGADLNGAAIGVHKAVVNGETIYRLRVGGLTKADAAALCARVKGDGGDCFIAK
jgi:sporulation related protein